MTWQNCTTCARHGQFCFVLIARKITQRLRQYWPSNLLSCLYFFSPLHFPFLLSILEAFQGFETNFFPFLLHTLLTKTPLQAKVPTEAQSWSNFVITESLVRRKLVTAPPVVKSQCPGADPACYRTAGFVSHGPARLQVVHMLPNHSGSTNQSPFTNHCQQWAWFRCDGDSLGG